MSNIRCGNCGFLNFASATECKRCQATFVESSPAEIVPPFAQLPSPAFEGGYEMSQPYMQPAAQPYYFPTPVAPLPQVSRNGAANASLWVMLGLAVSIAIGIGLFWKLSRPSAANVSWQEYNAQDNSYSVMLPGKPIESIQNQPTPAGDVQAHIATIGPRDDGFYLVGYTNFPSTSRKFSVDDMLDAAAQGGANQSGATIVNKQPITLQGHQGLEVEMNVPPEKVPGGGRVYFRLYWSQPRLYMVMIGGSDSSDILATRATFLDSFKIRE